MKNTAHAKNLVVFVSAAILSSGAAAASDGKSRQILIQNDSLLPIIGFQASPPTAKDWGENMLASDIAPGESISINLDKGTNECLYDLKITRSDGKKFEYGKAPVCGGGKWQLTKTQDQLMLPAWAHPDYPEYAWLPENRVVPFVATRTKDGCIFYDSYPMTQREWDKVNSDRKAVYEWIGSPCVAGQPITGQGEMLRTYWEGQTRTTEWNRSRGTLDDGYWEGPQWNWNSTRPTQKAAPDWIYYGGCSVNAENRYQWWGDTSVQKCKPRPRKHVAIAN